MVRASPARARVWGVVGALAAVAALAFLFVTLLGPHLGIQLFTPQPTVVPIHLADPRYSVLSTAVAPDGSRWFTEERYQLNGGNGYTNGPAKIGHATADGKLADYPLPPGNTFKPDPIMGGALVVGPDGRLWFVECQGGLLHTAPPRDTIAAIGPDGRNSEYPLPFASSMFFQPVVDAPLVLGPDGTLWFDALVATHLGSAPGTTPTVDTLVRITPAGANDARASAIGRVTPSGANAEYPLPSGDPDTALVPYSALVRNGPDLWSALAQASCPPTAKTCVDAGSVARITPAGAITAFPLPTPGVLAGNLIAGGDGDLYFVESASHGPPVPMGNDKLGRVTPTGRIVEFAVPTHQGADFNLLAGGGDTLWLTGSPMAGQTGTSFILRITPPRD